MNQHRSEPRILPQLLIIICAFAGFLFTWIDWKTTSLLIDDKRFNPSVRRAESGRFAQDACTEECCESFFAECADGSSNNPLSSLPYGVQIVMIIVLLACSALFSGLTLGLMGLDKTGLEIVMDGGDAKNAEYARRIYPVRQTGNLLLCTLLLGNTSVNALLSILLADKAGGTAGFLISTFSILVLGEITPQAFCSRYALKVGSLTVPVVRVIMFVLYPVTKPISLVLDRALGDEIATTYSSSELLKMLEIHVKENAMDKETANAMTGALTYKDTSVSQVMTPLANTFMLSLDAKLNFETIASIFKAGYSRIPVYEIDRNNVIGLLLVKDLIFIDPEDETRLADFVQIFGRPLKFVWPDDKLGDVLRELKTGRSHMALVRDVNNKDENQDPFYDIKGIITLEDIIEEIIGDEIVDETDEFVDGTHSQPVNRAETFEWARLRLLDAKIVDERLSQDEVKAITAHLSRNYPEVVALLTDRQLSRLVAETPVTLLSTAVQEVGERLPPDLIYQKDIPSDICTLILSGKVTVVAGSEDFRSDVSSWCVLGSKSLVDSLYKPDFSAFVSSGPCRCLRITRDRFSFALDASTAERLSSHSKVISAPVVVGPSDASAHSNNSEERARKGQLLAALQIARKGNLQVSGGEASAGVLHHFDEVDDK